MNTTLIVPLTTSTSDQFQQVADHAEELAADLRAGIERSSLADRADLLARMAGVYAKRARQFQPPPHLDPVLLNHAPRSRPQAAGWRN